MPDRPGGRAAAHHELGPGIVRPADLRGRIPVILREALDLNPTFDEEIRRNIEALHDELTAGAIRGLIEDAPDRSFWMPRPRRMSVGAGWRRRGIGPRRTSTAACWRRRATFSPVPGRASTPTPRRSAAEWAPDAAPQVVAQLLESLPDDDLEAQCERLLHADLWGNRTDLSYMVAAHLGTATAP